MTRTELYKAMRTIVINVTGIETCVLDDQNVTAPTVEYCSIEPFANIRSVGRGTISNEDIAAEDEIEDYYDIQETITTLIEAKVSVNFFRGNARLYAQQLLFADGASDVYEVLRENDIAWMRTDAANNLTVLNSGKQEPRAQINIYIQFEQSRTNTVQRIYNSDAEVYNEDNELVESFTIETKED